MIGVLSLGSLGGLQPYGQDFSQGISMSRNRTSQKTSIAADGFPAERSSNMRGSGTSFVSNQKISWRTCIGRERRCTRGSMYSDATFE